MALRTNPAGWPTDSEISLTCNIACGIQRQPLHSTESSLSCKHDARADYVAVAVAYYGGQCYLAPAREVEDDAKRVGSHV
jgi:hypothetical protein